MVNTRVKRKACVAPTESFREHSHTNEIGIEGTKPCSLEGYVKEFWLYKKKKSLDTPWNFKCSMLERGGEAILTLNSDFSPFIYYLLVKGVFHPQSKTENLEASRFNLSLKSVSSTSCTYLKFMAFLSLLSNSDFIVFLDLYD